MSTTAFPTTIMPCQPATVPDRAQPTPKRSGLVQRAYSLCTGCCQLVGGLVCIVASMVATAAAVAAAVFIFAWLLMLPLILAGGLIHAVEVAVRWV